MAIYNIQVLKNQSVSIAEDYYSFNIIDHVSSIYEIAFEYEKEKSNILNEDADTIKRNVSYYIDRIIQKVKEFFRFISRKIKDIIRNININNIEKDIRSGKLHLTDTQIDKLRNAPSANELINKIKENAIKIAKGEIDSAENVW